MACFYKSLFAGFHSFYLVASGQQDAVIAICSLVSGAVVQTLLLLCHGSAVQWRHRRGNNHDTSFHSKLEITPIHVGQYFIWKIWNWPEGPPFAVFTIFSLYIAAGLGSSSKLSCMQWIIIEAAAAAGGSSNIVTGYRLQGHTDRHLSWGKGYRQTLAAWQRGTDTPM